MDSYKFCVVCGRRIPELSLRRKTCSKYCYRRAKSGYTPYIDYEGPPYDDLTEIQKKAQSLGLSYGQYVALKENEKTIKQIFKSGVKTKLKENSKGGQ